MFVGAHPDDEWGVAPLLAEACIARGAKCHFLVAAEARSYGCFMTVGLPDPVACSALRRQEMMASVAMFGASVEFFGWQDFFYSFDEAGVERTIAGWADASGGRDALVARFEGVLRELRPSLVFTLDPRHGSTCHPGHRGASLLFLEALERLPAQQRPIVWLEQTDNIDERSEAVAAANAQVGYVGWPETNRETVWYDANVRLPNGKTAFDYALDTRRAHATQFPAEASGDAVPNPPRDLRLVPLARYDGRIAPDFCTVLRLERPTFDVPGNMERFGLQ